MRVATVKTQREAADPFGVAAPKTRLGWPCRSDQPKIREMVRLFLREIGGDTGEDEEECFIGDFGFDEFDEDAEDEKEGSPADAHWHSPAPRVEAVFRLHPDMEADAFAQRRQCHDAQEDADTIAPAWMDMGADIWWQRPASLFPMLIHEGESPVGFLLIASGQYTDPDTDYEVAGLFVMPACRRRGVARAALLAAFERFPGWWEAVPANLDDAFGFWFNLIDCHFWEYQLAPYSTGFQFENVPANIKRENPFHHDSSGVTNGYWSMPSP